MPRGIPRWSLNSRDAAEKDIVFAVERGDLAIRFGQQSFEHSRADAKQRVMRDVQFGFGDELEIHEPLDRGKMRGANILAGNAECGIRSAGWRRIFIQKTFDSLAIFQAR